MQIFIIAFFRERLCDMLSLHIVRWIKRKDRRKLLELKRKKVERWKKIELQSKKHVMPKRKDKNTKNDRSERLRMREVEKYIVCVSVCIALPQCAVLITFRIKFPHFFPLFSFFSIVVIHVFVVRFIIICILKIEISMALKRKEDRLSEIERERERGGGLEKPSEEGKYSAREKNAQPGTHRTL